MPQYTSYGIERPTAREMNYLAEKAQEDRGLTGNRASRRATTDTRSKKAKIMAGNAHAQLMAPLFNMVASGVPSKVTDPIYVRNLDILARNGRLQKLGAVL